MARRVAEHVLEHLHIGPGRDREGGAGVSQVVHSKAGEPGLVQRQLHGLAMPFLGQRDEALPIRPSDLVPRGAVIDYPTNFSAMRTEDIDRLATRGEQLTRLMIEHHCPEIS